MLAFTADGIARIYQLFDAHVEWAGGSFVNAALIGEIEDKTHQLRTSSGRLLSSSRKAEQSQRRDEEFFTSSHSAEHQPDHAALQNAVRNNIGFKAPLNVTRRRAWLKSARHGYEAESCGWADRGT